MSDTNMNLDIKVNLDMEDAIEMINKLEDKEVTLNVNTKVDKSNFKETAKEISGILTSSLVGAGKDFVGLSGGIFKGLTTTISRSVVAGFNYAKREAGNIVFPFRLGKTDGIQGQIKRLLIGVGALSLVKRSIGLSSDMTESANRTEFVFGKSAKSISDFARTTAREFGLTELAGIKYASTMGGILRSAQILDNRLPFMAKNLAKMTGDLASFYDVDQEVMFEKLQSGLTGNVAALRAFGINVSKTNLELYRQAQGIDVAYSKMDEASKEILRYNYIVTSASIAQGDFARTQYTWANQIRLLTSNFQQLGSIVGGYFVKTLLPVVHILNMIVQAAVNAFTSLAGLFGFSQKDIAKLTGGVEAGSIEQPQYGADPEEVDKGTEALKKQGDQSRKNRKENELGLATFDKLNNITTNKGNSGAGSKGKGVGAGSGVKANIKPLDWTALGKGKPIKTPLEEWFDRFFNKLKLKKFKGAGEELAKGVNSLVYKLNTTLEDPKLRTNISKFNDYLTDFASGFVDNFDYRNTGRLLGNWVNTVTFYINDLYDKLYSKNIASNLGEGIANGITAFFYRLDGKALGEAIVFWLKVGVEFAEGFVGNIKFDLIGTRVKETILGAVDSLGNEHVPERLGKTIGSFISGAFALIGNINSDGKAGERIRESVVTTINTAIKEIKQSDLEDGSKSILNFIGSMFGIVKDINTEALSDKLSGTLNGLVKDGTIRNIARNISGAIANIIKLGVQTIDKTDKLELGKAIIEGISDGISETNSADEITKALTALFALRVAPSLAGKGLSSLGDAILTGIGVRLGVGSALKASGLVGAIEGLGSNALLTGAASKAGSKLLTFASKAALPAAVAAVVFGSASKSTSDARVTESDIDKKVAELKAQIAENNSYVEGFSLNDKDVTKFTVQASSYVDAFNELSTAQRGVLLGGDFFKLLTGAWGEPRENVIKYAKALDKVIEGTTLAESVEAKQLHTLVTTKSESNLAANHVNDLLVLCRNLHPEVATLSTALFEGGEATERFVRALGEGKNLTSLEKRIEKATERIDTNFVTAMQNAVVAVKTGGSDLNTEFEKITQTIGIELNQMPPHAQKKAKELVKYLTTEVINGKMSVKEAAEEIKKVVVDNLPTKTEGERSGTNTVNGIRVGITSKTSKNNTIESVQNFLSAVQRGSSKKANSVGATLGDTLTSGIPLNFQEEAKKQALAQKLGNFLGDIANKVKGTLSTIFRPLGLNITDGISKGMEGAKALLNNAKAANKVISNTEKHARKAADSHSPARRFMPLGVNITEGIGVGMTSSKAKHSLVQASKDIMKATEKGLSSVDTSKFYNSNKFKNFKSQYQAISGMKDTDLRVMMKQYSLLRSQSKALPTGVGAVGLGSQAGLLSGITNLSATLNKRGRLGKSLLSSQQIAELDGAMRERKYLAGNTDSTGAKKVHISLYLDKFNKLEEFIVNTVDNSVTKTGQAN